MWLEVPTAVSGVHSMSLPRMVARQGFVARLGSVARPRSNCTNATSATHGLHHAVGAQSTGCLLRCSAPHMLAPESARLTSRLLG